MNLLTQRNPNAKQRLPMSGCCCSAEAAGIGICKCCVKLQCDRQALSRGVRSCLATLNSF